MSTTRVVARRGASRRASPAARSGGGPGRTLLVMLLVAIPVFAMTVGSVLFRTGPTRTRNASAAATAPPTS